MVQLFKNNGFLKLLTFTEESEDEEDKEIEQAESEYLNRPDAEEGDKDEKENNEEEESRFVLTRFLTAILHRGLRNNFFFSIQPI